MTTEKLDNPVYFSLTETHQHMAVSYNGMKFYQPNYCAFGGFADIKNSENGIDAYSELTDSFYIIGKQPNFNKQVCLKKELICSQIILDKPCTIEINQQIIQLQTTTQKAELSNLVNLVQPGYFKSHTSAMGNYYGIYKDKQLIAVTGERMKMNAFTEVSAVVTHPQHTKKGYAKQLISFTCQQIFKQGKTPYLHVAETNNIAIKLYEKLGFQTRRKISFWNFVKLK